MINAILLAGLLSGSILSEAKADLGLREGSSRQIQMMRLAMPKTKNVARKPWCAGAASEWIAEAGYKIHRTASVSELKKELQRKGWQRISQPIPGSVAFLTTRSHVGIVSSVKGNRVTIISGNHNNKVGSSTVSKSTLECWTYDRNKKI